MKFIHTSDWHIGRYFHNVSLLADQAHFLQQLLTTLEAEAVDALVIAGDIYDRAVPPAPAVALLNDTLATISQMGIPILMIPGNHDSAERLGFCSAPLKQANIHIFGDLKNIAEGVTLTGKNGTAVTFFGLPYAHPNQGLEAYGQHFSTHQELLDHQLDLIKNEPQESEIPRVLISHHFVGGASETESERPLSVGGSEMVSANSMADFDYVALGHLHRAQACRFDHVRYSGSPLKYSFSEANDHKSFTVVEFNDKAKVGDEQAQITTRPIIPKRDVAILDGFFEDIINAAQQNDTDEANGLVVSKDFYLVRLKNQEALLNVMERLQVYYPNLLHIERALPALPARSAEHSRDALRQNESDLFARFYQDMTGQALLDSQRDALAKVIEEVYENTDDD